MMTEDIVACNSETAVFILKHRQSVELFELFCHKAAWTTKFPLEWTQETATDFTRVLQPLPEGWVDSFTQPRANLVNDVLYLC